MHYEFPWQRMSSFLRKDLRAQNKWRVYDSFLSHFSNLVWKGKGGGGVCWAQATQNIKGASGVMQWMSIKHFCEHQIMFHLSTFYILFDAKNLNFRLVWIIFECGSAMVTVVGAMTSNNKTGYLFHFFFGLRSETWETAPIFIILSVFFFFFFWRSAQCHTKILDRKVVILSDEMTICQAAYSKIEFKHFLDFFHYGRNLFPSVNIFFLLN